MRASPTKSPAAMLGESSACALPISARTAVIELGSMVVVIELIEWAVPLMGNSSTAYGGLAFSLAILMAFCFVRDGLTAKQLGIRIDNLISSLAHLLPFLSIFVLALVGTGLACHSLKLDDRFRSMLLVVPPWALLQQYMLLGFARPRLRILVGNGESLTLAAAALFAALHLPNPALAIICALGGYVWAREFASRPNLFANALTHTVASAFVANSLPHWLLRNMVVGYNHFLR